MLANLPPLGLFHAQTLGGVYSGVSVIPVAPDRRAQAGAVRIGSS
jgi:hypothetical protein